MGRPCGLDYKVKDGKEVDARWGKGHKEDFDFEALEAAIELHEEHEEEDK